MGGTFHLMTQTGFFLGNVCVQASKAKKASFAAACPHCHLQITLVFYNSNLVVVYLHYPRPYLLHSCYPLLPSGLALPVPTILNVTPTLRRCWLYPCPRGYHQKKYWWSAWCLSSGCCWIGCPAIEPWRFPFSHAASVSFWGYGVVVNRFVVIQFLLKAKKFPHIKY